MNKGRGEGGCPSTKALRQKPSDDIRGGLVDFIINLLDILLTDIRNIRHKVRNTTLGIGELFLDIVVAKDLVDAAEHTGDIRVDVTDADKVALVGGDRSQVDFREVDSADGGAEEQVA